ncbi:MAG: hypothetical protein ABJH05_05945 [Fulvivirga sp.]
MPAPEYVNPEKFKVVKVLYNHNDFSVALGTWTPSNEQIIGMRWNDGEDGKGYPKAFGNPQWFVVSNDIAKNTLSGLLTSAHISNTQYLDILETLKSL